jgi:hypothetical protein
LIKNPVTRFFSLFFFLIPPVALRDAICALDRIMELLNGTEFKDIRLICQETMNVFGKAFMESAKCELFVSAVRNHQEDLMSDLKPSILSVPPRNGRNIVPSRLSSSIPPHIHDDNRTYEQDPSAKLTATIVGWREVKALTHYGVRLFNPE